MDDKPKNLCLDFPQFNVRKPYHLEIDNDGNIVYPECEKINGINIVKQPKVAFEQLEKMLQGGFKRDELVCITATSSDDNSVGRHMSSLYPILAKLANTGKAVVFDTEENGFVIKDTVTDTTLGNLELVKNKDKELQIVRVKSRHNSLDNLEWVPRDNNEFAMRALGKKDDFTLLTWDIIISKSTYKDKLKDIRKVYEKSQKTYKLAIKNYNKFITMYKGYRYSEVPIEIRDVVSKCSYPLNDLIRKSNEVRLVLDWLNRGEVALINVNNKHVLKTITKIKRSVYENSKTN